MLIPVVICDVIFTGIDILLFNSIFIKKLIYELKFIFGFCNRLNYVLMESKKRENTVKFIYKKLF